MEKNITCSQCGGKSYVKQIFRDIDVIARSRKCQNCDHIFYTIEYEADEAERIFNKLKELENGQ